MTAWQPGWNRRRWLAACAITAAWQTLPGAQARTANAARGATDAPDAPVAPAALPATLSMVAAWQAGDGFQVGVLERRAGGAFVQRAALTVPTRAHGLWVEPGGTLLATARRPGDWLLRWRPDGTEVAWGWIEPDRAFNGHVIASADGRRLFTTETDLETGQGLIGVRDTASLQKIAEWPTHGMDPHELLLDADGSLLVANGGIPTLPESGRLKIRLDQMDASLVRLGTRDGALRGQWRLADQRLSLRHMAWAGDRPRQRTLALALQGEHADAAAKAASPVLALFDGERLRTVEAPQPLQGYGGDVACADGFVAVSCPRAQGVALWHGDGRWAGFTALPEACPLAAVGLVGPDASAQQSLWAGGRTEALALRSAQAGEHAGVSGLRLDNHWVVLAQR